MSCTPSPFPKFQKIEGNRSGQVRSGPKITWNIGKERLPGKGMNNACEFASEGRVPERTEREQDLLTVAM
jgi:hypothetical protein